MPQHDMGPSTVAGFEQQCRKCKALDTEIRFSLGQDCPVDDIQPPPGIPLAELNQAHNDMPQPVADIAEFMESMGFVPTNPDQCLVLIMSTWFDGFFERQFLRAGANDA